MNTEFETYCDLIRQLRDAELAVTKSNKQLSIANNNVRQFLLAHPDAQTDTPFTKQQATGNKPTRNHIPFGSLAKTVREYIAAAATGITFVSLANQINYDFIVNPSSIRSAVKQMQYNGEIAQVGGLLTLV